MGEAEVDISMSVEGATGSTNCPPCPETDARGAS